MNANRFPALRFGVERGLGGIYRRVANLNADVATKGWRVRDDILSGYLQLNIDTTLGSNRLTGNVGVQLVNTVQTSNGIASTRNSGNVLNMPITDRASHRYALPTLNRVLRGEHDLVARLGPGRQLAGARMNEMRASINCNFNESQVSCPNVEQGFVSVCPNRDGGEIYGFELTGSRSFSMFMPVLEGFGVQRSFSFTEKDITPNPNDPSQPLPGLSRHVWNATGYFERSGFSARGSVRYRSSLLAEARGLGGGLERRFANAETIVDAQIGYAFQPGSAFEGVTVLAQAYNLSNEPLSISFIPDERLVRDSESYGRRFLFGVNDLF